MTGRIKAIGFNLASYLTLCLTAILYWLLIRWPFISVTVIGRNHLRAYRQKRGWLVVGNHQSNIDSWFLGATLAIPWVFLKPWLAPWHLPETKDYTSRGFLHRLIKLSKGIFIKRGTGDFSTMLPLLASRLRRGSMIIFPEGGRHRQPTQAEVGRCRLGTAELACAATDITILPVALYGAHTILPIGSKTMGFWRRRVIIVIGEPMQPTELGLTGGPDGKKQLLAAIQARLQTLLIEAKTAYDNKTRLTCRVQDPAC